MTAALVPDGLAGAFAAVLPGPDSFGYTVAPTSAFTFTNITNGTRVLYFNDDAAITVNLGFSFDFYGLSYTTISFTPNGYMTFGGQSREYANVDLTTSSPSNNLPAIAVLWDDWETQSLHTDGLYYKTLGSPGGRQFVVQWNRVVPVLGDGTNTVTFQARLFERSNQILFSYLDAVVSDESTPVASLGVGATVGIRDINGQINNRNLQWSYNQPVITDGLNLLFAPPNHSPIAAQDTVMTAEDTPVTINVLANDSDEDGNLLAIVSVSQGANGAVATNVNGTVTYRPVTNFFGADAFTYSITDGQGGSATGVVSVTVRPINDAPVARNDAYGVSEDETLTVFAPGVLGNDSDVDEDQLRAILVTGPSKGALILRTDGSFVYTPNAHTNGTDNFVYCANDSSLNSSNATVTVTVWPALRIISVLRLANGHVRLRLQGIAGRSYAIEISSDLQNWSSSGAAAEVAPGEFELEDAEAVGVATRFYRAVEQ